MVVVYLKNEKQFIFQMDNDHGCSLCEELETIQFLKGCGHDHSHIVE